MKQLLIILLAVLGFCGALRADSNALNAFGYSPEFDPPYQLPPELVPVLASQGYDTLVAKQGFWYLSERFGTGSNPEDFAWAGFLEHHFTRGKSWYGIIPSTARELRVNTKSGDPTVQILGFAKYLDRWTRGRKTPRVITDCTFLKVVGYAPAYAWKLDEHSDVIYHKNTREYRSKAFVNSRRVNCYDTDGNGVITLGEFTDKINAKLERDRRYLRAKLAKLPQRQPVLEEGNSHSVQLATVPAMMPNAECLITDNASQTQPVVSNLTPTVRHNILSHLIFCWWRECPLRKPAVPVAQVPASDNLLGIVSGFFESLQRYQTSLIQWRAIFA